MTVEIVSESVMTKQEQAPSPQVALGVDAAICVLTDPTSLTAEAVRGLRTQIVARHVDQGRRALAMIAPSAGVGLTTLTINLAITLAQSGLRTLLIDANLRQPGVTEALGLTGNAGLAGLLDSGSGAAGGLVIDDVIPGLSILPAGNPPASSHELLAGPHFRHFVRGMMREYDLTLFDTSPANESPDALAVSNAAGYAVLVSRRDYSYARDVKTLYEQLSNSGSVVIGTVLNGF